MARPRGRAEPRPASRQALGRRFCFAFYWQLTLSGSEPGCSFPVSGSSS